MTVSSPPSYIAPAPRGRPREASGPSFSTGYASVRQPSSTMSVEHEYRAAREGCALYSAEMRQLLIASGDDRVIFLHGMLSNDIKKLQAGEGIDAALLTQQGKIVSDLRVYAEGDRLLI